MGCLSINDFSSWEEPLVSRDVMSVYVIVMSVYVIVMSVYVVVTVLCAPDNSADNWAATALQSYPVRIGIRQQARVPICWPLVPVY